MANRTLMQQQLSANWGDKMAVSQSFPNLATLNLIT
jgi:hypothetical protein